MIDGELISNSWLFLNGFVFMGIFNFCGLQRIMGRILVGPEKQRLQRDGDGAKQGT
jgi:hypothetical protein